MEKHIEIPSFRGTARNEYITEGNEKLAVILPGHRYTNMAPLLYYSLNIVLGSGYDALAVEYGFQRSGGKFVPDKDSFDHLVKEVKEAVDICLKEKRYGEILFIGKSLGTLVQTLLKDKLSGYPQRHVFLTPLPECIGFIKQTDCMVAVGTKDRVFKEEYINEISELKNVTLITFDGADHSLETGSYIKDLKVLAEVCGGIYTFINKQTQYNQRQDRR